MPNSTLNVESFLFRNPILVRITFVRFFLNLSSPPFTLVFLTGIGTLCGCDGLPEEEEEADILACDSDSALPAGARLMTRSEYRRTVADLLKTDNDPTATFPAEPVVDGFNNNAKSHQTNPLLVEKYAESAQKLAREAAERELVGLLDCDGSQGTAACAKNFIENFGRRAFRRPLSTSERDSFGRLYNRVAPSFSHLTALETVLEAMLQSPQFLYRIEAPVSESSDNRIALGAYEIASRLSYFLWGSLPDDELLDAAEAGELSRKAGIEQQARRLLADKRAHSRIREFHSQWLNLDRLKSLAREDAPDGFAASNEESLLRFTDHIFWSDSSEVSELYLSSELFVDDKLADVHGIKRRTPEQQWEVISQEETRHGLVTQPTLMTLLAHAGQSSPIQRGVFVREHFLCEVVAPPPPSVNNNPPDPDPSLTTRERFAIHTEAPACASCHELIDPLGFGFEAYDHLGRHRTREADQPIDESGALVGLSEIALEGPFDGAAELADKIADSETILSCLAKKWFTFALGRPHREKDECALDYAVDESRKYDGSMQELLVAIAKSDAFRFRAAHDSDGAAQ